MGTYIEADADLPLVRLMARASDPPTSKAAAATGAALAAEHEPRILEALRQGPAHRDEIARRAGMAKDEVWRRLAAMERRGLIAKAGTARGESGHRQSVYRRVNG
jgi:predicted Rossmann fold nucleotide-binding protein DprA/Smf involved in DNA uptake